MTFPREHWNKGWFCAADPKEISKRTLRLAQVLARKMRRTALEAILSDIRRMCTVLSCLHLDCTLPVQRTPTLAGTRWHEQPESTFLHGERMPRTRVRVSSRPFFFPSTASSTSSSSSSRSAGRRAGAGCKSIAMRRWSKRASAEIARWAGLNGGSARVLNTSYLADQWVLRLPLAQLVACWLESSDLHWWTLSSCGTGGAWASISRYTRLASCVPRKPRFGRSLALRCSSCRTSSSTWEESPCRSFAVRRVPDAGPDRSRCYSLATSLQWRDAALRTLSSTFEVEDAGSFVRGYYNTRLETSIP